MTPSPAVTTVRRERRNVWPPKTSSVRELPKTGFSPTIVRESSQGKKFIWPPPSQNMYSNNEVGQLAHHIPGEIQWNPSSPSQMRKGPVFAPQDPRPARRRTDDIWPPRNITRTEMASAPIPKPVKRVGRFDNYIKHTASIGVPVTYRAPPGTQYVQYVEEEVVEEEEVEEEEVEEEEEDE